MFEQTDKSATQKTLVDSVEAQWQASFADPKKGVADHTRGSVNSAPPGRRAMLSIVERGDTNHNDILEIPELKSLHGGNAQKIATRYSAFRAITGADQGLPQEAAIIDGYDWLEGENVTDALLDRLGTSSKARQAVAKLHPDVTKRDGTKVGPEEISIGDAREYVSATNAQFGLGYLKAQSNNIDKKYGNGDKNLTDAELSAMIKDQATYRPLTECLVAAQTQLRRMSGLDVPSKAICTQELIEAAEKIVSAKLALDQQK